MLYPAELRAPTGDVPASCRRRQCLLAGLGLLLWPALPARAEEVAWAAVRPGWTIELTDGSVLRLAELAPEGSSEALERLLAPGRLRFAEVGPVDRSGARPALVWQGEASLQQRLVAAGRARVLPTYDDDLAARLLLLEDAAREEERGLWGSGAFVVHPTAPTPAVDGFQVLRGAVVSASRTDRFLYLNFGERYRESVSVRIRPRDGRSWGLTDRLHDFVGRVVEVRGFAFEDGGPMLELDHPAQLRVVDARPAP
ncbi:MAG: thermonuclease family protein [Pseudomonadota bacterium]